MAVKVHTLKIEDPMRLSGEALEALQRAISSYSELGLISQSLRRSLSTRWYVYQGGRHIALHRATCRTDGDHGARVAIIEERDAVEGKA